MFNNQAFGTEISSDAVARQLDQRRQPFLNSLQNEGYEVTILGTTHAHFGSDAPFLYPMLLESGIDLGNGVLETLINDLLNPAASTESYEFENFELIDPNRVTQIVNSYTTAFFNQHLNNQTSPLLADHSSPRPEAYPEVIFQSYKGGNITSDKEGNDVLYGGPDNDLLHGGGGTMS